MRWYNDGSYFSFEAKDKAPIPPIVSIIPPATSIINISDPVPVFGILTTGVDGLTVFGGLVGLTGLVGVQVTPTSQVGPNVGC